MAVPTWHDFASRRFATPAGPVTNQVSQRAAIPLAFLLWRLHIHPNVITLSGLALSITASVVLVSQGNWFPAVLAAVLFNLGYVMDCCDGQVARAARKTSTFGSFLDLSSDAVLWLSLGTSLALRMEDAGLGLWSILGVAFSASKIIQMNAGLVVAKLGAPRRQKRGFLVEFGRIGLDTPTTLLLLPLASLWVDWLPFVVGAFVAGNIFQAGWNVLRSARATRPSS